MKKYIVVGAGILGASTAYHLAKSGIDVTLIDGNDSGQATDAAAGIVCPWISQRRNKRWYQLVKEGAKYYPELIQQLEEIGERVTGYQRVGALSLHIDEDKIDKMVQRALKRKEDAPEMGEILKLSKEETLKRFPLLAEGFSSVFVSGAARVDGRLLRKALISGAVKYGAEHVHGTAELLIDNDEINGVVVNNEKVFAETVIVTAGAWANKLLLPLGVSFHVSAQKGQIIHLQLSEENTSSWPVVMPPNNQYLLAFDGGRIVIGATHENKENLTSNVTAGGLHEVLSKALQVAPGLKESTHIETRVGFRPFTPEFLPVFGEVPNWKGLFLANGLGASGLTAGPFLGAELAKLVLDRDTILDPKEFPLEEALF
ncbi:NAD(P)/FAD-dependent oxidoreductase [Bacillus sp. 2205SS5-2]|uniref:NAD(P)/FAD-dependent oxidoreductase n=1 Tax=Bacillus sp. 2205SS5-2 TaxID=3109031 RepID=UPI003003BB49